MHRSISFRLCVTILAPVIVLVAPVFDTLASINIVSGTEDNLASLTLSTGSYADGDFKELPEPQSRPSRSVPVANKNERVTHMHESSTFSTGTADAVLSPEKFSAKVISSVNSFGKKADAGSNAQASATLEVSGIAGLDYTVMASAISNPKQSHSVLLNGRDDRLFPYGTLEVAATGTTRFQFTVTASASVTATSVGYQANASSISIAFKPTGEAAKGTLYESAPNRYEGLFPIRNDFGRTRPYNFNGLTSSAPGFLASNVDDVGLAFSVSENSFASITIPNTPSGDPLQLGFEGHTWSVSPGSTFDLLPFVPSGISQLWLTGNGLSAGSVTGFTFTQDGMADISMEVGAVPEPQSALLAVAGGMLIHSVTRSRRKSPT